MKTMKIIIGVLLLLVFFVLAIGTVNNILSFG
jgi:hypothetical protein